MNLQDYERKRQKKNINKREERIRSEINEIRSGKIGDKFNEIL